MSDNPGTLSLIQPNIGLFRPAGSQAQPTPMEPERHVPPPMLTRRLRLWLLEVQSLSSRSLPRFLRRRLHSELHTLQRAWTSWSIR